MIAFMRKTLLLFIFVIISAFLLHSQAAYRKINNEAFKRGEKLTYRIHYGFIDAAIATIEITDENKRFADRSTLHVVGICKSKGSFDFFFKIRDRVFVFVFHDVVNICFKSTR